MSCPTVGIYYFTWFGLNSPLVQPDPWENKPFGLDNVASAVFTPSPQGVRYSSLDTQTAFIHANMLSDMGVSFVIFDDTNTSKDHYPIDNPIFQASLKAAEGFRSNTLNKVRISWMLSINGWNPGETGPTYFRWNDFIKAHIREIAKHHVNHPDDIQLVSGKPLLLFYISKGSDVLVSADSPVPAFHGTANVYPTVEDLGDYAFELDGVTHRLFDFFAVRYAVVAASVFDFTNYSSDIWPFTCYYGDSTFTEVGYASLLAPLRSPNRSLEMFNQLVDKGRSKNFIIVRGWNEFSGGDEPSPAVYTIEPNTQLYKHDSTPGNADPWWFYKGIRTKLRSCVSDPIFMLGAHHDNEIRERLNNMEERLREHHAILSKLDHGMKKEKGTS